MDIYTQIEGNSKGNKVEVIQEKGGLLTVRDIKTDFLFFISLKDFQRCYEAQNDEN